MAETIGLLLLGLVIGASVVRAAEARKRRRIARLVELVAPYRAVGTAEPSDITVGSTARAGRRIGGRCVAPLRDRPVTDNARRLRGGAMAEFNEALQRASVSTERASESFHRFVHVAFHHGEGQVPNTCELCRRALDE